MTTIMSYNLAGVFFFGCIIIVACLVAAVDAFMTWYHMYRMDVIDEFEAAYDPYADAAPSWNSIDSTRTVMFQDVTSMDAWLRAEVPNETRKVQLYIQAVVNRVNTGMYKFSIELSNTERLRVL